MNALKLADLNESSSRSLLQRAVPPCSPDFLSIYTEFPPCVSKVEMDFDMATRVKRKYQIEMQTTT